MEEKEIFRQFSRQQDIYITKGWNSTAKLHCGYWKGKNGKIGLLLKALLWSRCGNFEEALLEKIIKKEIKMLIGNHQNSFKNLVSFSFPQILITMLSQFEFIFLKIRQKFCLFPDIQTKLFANHLSIYLEYLSISKFLLAFLNHPKNFILKMPKSSWKSPIQWFRCIVFSFRLTIQSHKYTDVWKYCLCFCNKYILYFFTLSKMVLLS